jgi:hypothetical protein
VIIQGYLLPFYYYATGGFALLVYVIFKYSGYSTNKAAMDSTATDAASVASRNSYATTAATGLWLGIWAGVFAIIPTTILGIVTLPLTAPIVIWKTID